MNTANIYLYTMAAITAVFFILISNIEPVSAYSFPEPKPLEAHCTNDSEFEFTKMRLQALIKHNDEQIILMENFYGKL